MKSWEAFYSGSVIVVENGLSGECLYVNGALQDKQTGLAFRSRLWGQLPTGETIKVSLGGFFSIHCTIFVDNTLILSK